MDAEELSTVANICERLQAIECAVVDASRRRGHIIDDDDDEDEKESVGREWLDEDEVVVQEYIYLKEFE